MTNTKIVPPLQPRDPKFHAWMIARFLYSQTAFTRVIAVALFSGLAAGIANQASQADPAPPRAVEFEELRATIETLQGKQPLRGDVSGFVADKQAAQILGKAFFWDIQVGSDGGACASCHFAGGADIRITNQVNPGLRGGDHFFNQRAGNAGLSGPNVTFTAADFPFHRLKNPKDRDSEIVFDTNDVFSSQGTFGGQFISNGTDANAPKARPVAFRPHLLVNANASAPQGVERDRDRSQAERQTPFNESCSYTYEPSNNPFHTNNTINRKVEPRQAPTVINAVFNYRQFWDGRANNQFNGVDPFGPRTFQPKTDSGKPGNPNVASSGTLVYDPNQPKGALQLSLKQILIANSSLASQAVGPALSNFEMSCENKTFQNLGQKLITMRPLALQSVHPHDSLFSRAYGLVPRDGKGLSTTYRRLIQKAFHAKYWRDDTKVSILSDGRVVKDSNGYTQMEQNFSLFWGLAVQEYIALLVSDDSPFDRAMNGDTKAMSDKAKVGQMLFLNKGSCANCHFGPVFSSATFTKDTGPNPKVLEHMAMADGTTALYDSGFYNIGVRPTSEDIGVGGTDPYGFDLSLARSLKWQQLGKPELAPDKFDATPCRWIIQFSPCTNVPKWTNPIASERDTVDGSFKAPSLRNVGLTPPYFHNGGESNLRDVLRHYSRGGNRRGPLDNDTTGLPTPNPFGQIVGSNLDPDIGALLTPIPSQHNALLLTDVEIDDLVQFLLALTDERVACHAGIFDHPELPLPMGQLLNVANVTKAAIKPAKDIIRVLPAVGRRGLRASGKPCFPNSGDLFGSVNAIDKTPLQPTFEKILGYPGKSGDGKNGNDDGSKPIFAGWLENFDGSSLGASRISNGGGNISGPNPGFAPGLNPVSATRGGTARAVRATAANPIVALAASGTAPPVVPAPVFTAPTASINGFTAIGFIQDATVTPCQGLPQSQWGGTATINGITIAIPCNSIVQMSAATFTWSDLFNPDKFQSTQKPPALLTLAGTQPASPSPAQFAFPSTELRIVGNIVNGKHIAGLVYISQQSLNSGTGVVTGFDYENGVIFVGRTANEKPMVRLQLNDPKILDPADPAFRVGWFSTGRFSAGQTPDQRFSVDQQNPTSHASTAYPMCVPRKDPTLDPSTEIDPLCPQKNRPLVANHCRNFQEADFFLPTGRTPGPPAPGAVYCSSFVMKAPPGTPASVLPPSTGSELMAGPSDPDSTQQAPFEIGDLITWSGTLLRGDGQGPNGSDTISVHTITANVGIFTQPGTLPSYISIGEFRVGTSPPATTFQGVVLGEIDRIVLEAFTTDLASTVDIYLVDIDKTSGSETQRWITPGLMTGNAGGVGSLGRIIDGGIVTQFFGAQPGRVRLRATHPVRGILESPSRYLRVAVRSLCDPDNINTVAPLLNDLNGAPVDCLKRAPAANGLYSGQYLAPTFDFIFPENIVPGSPPVPNNFWDIGFLVNGEGPGTGGLIPTPW